MEINEIELKIAQGELSAPQVFTQMRQHITSDSEVIEELVEGKEELRLLKLIVAAINPEGIDTNAEDVVTEINFDWLPEQNWIAG